MADPIVLRTGASLQADGTNPQARACKTGEVAVSQVHGKYYEAASRGNLYAAGTAAGGVAPTTAVGTTGPFILENPRGSGKRLVLKKVSLAYNSGTMGPGVWWHCL